MLLALLPPYLIRGRNDNGPSPPPSPQGGEGVMEEFSPTREEGSRGTQAKACGYLTVSFILYLIMSSIICRMREASNPTLIRPPMSRGNSPSERKRSNYFSFKQITSHSPVGSRSSLISARVQEQVLHQTLIEVPSHQRWDCRGRADPPCDLETMMYPRAVLFKTSG